jgi:hypothetical protein
MKKLIASLIIAASLATPAIAKHKDDGSYRKPKTDWVAPLLGGIIIGALIASDREEPRRSTRYRQRYEDGYFEPATAYPNYETYQIRNQYREYEIIERGPNGHYCVTRNYVDRFGYPTLTKSCQ